MVNEQKAFEMMQSENKETARQGFEALCEIARQYPHKWLKNLPITPASQEEKAEIMQETLVRLCVHWEQLTFRRIGQWYAYLQRTAANIVIDRARRNPERRTDAAEPVTLSGPEQSLWESMEKSSLAEEIYRCANALWLQLDANLTLEAQTRRLLAAQYYLEGDSLDEILEILRLNPVAGEPPLTRDILGEWLRHPGVLRYVAFQKLHFSNRALLAHLLRKGDPAEIWAEVHAALKQEPETIEHQREVGMVAAALWRYGFALSPGEIDTHRKRLRADGALHDAWSVTLDQMDGLLAAWRNYLPFRRRTLEIQTWLHGKAQCDANEILCHHGLWKRLVFEYSVLDALTKPDIMERTQPAAAAIGYGLSEATVNGWKSNRLSPELLAYWQQNGREDAHV